MVKARVDPTMILTRFVFIFYFLESDWLYFASSTLLTPGLLKSLAQFLPIPDHLLADGLCGDLCLEIALEKMLRDSRFGGVLIAECNLRMPTMRTERQRYERKSP